MKRFLLPSVAFVIVISFITVVAFSIDYFVGNKEIYLEGETGIEMLHQVQEVLPKMHKGQTLKVKIMSPGGSVVTSLEIARLVREASDRGVIVEIHAIAFCASGCTFVLAAGTPGHRFITKQAVVLVHPIQKSNGYGPTRCVSRIETPMDVDEKMDNLFHDSGVNAYVKYTGKDKTEVLGWLLCKNEQVGFGVKAVEMGIADHVE